MTIHWLTIEIPRLTRALAAIAVLLAIASVTLRWVDERTALAPPRGIIELFDLDRERNVPTLFAAFLLLLSATLAATVAAFERARAGVDRWRWTALGMTLGVMVVDESLSFHERLIGPVRALPGVADIGLFHFAWVLPGFVVVALLAPLFAPLVGRLTPTVRRGVVLAAVLYLSGVLGIEMLGGLHAQRHGTDGFGYALIVTLEECLEMAGAIALVHALGRHVALAYGEFRVRVADAPASRRPSP